MEIVRITSDNIDSIGVGCITNNKHAGYSTKREWLLQRMEEGLELRLLLDEKGKFAGMVECVPGNEAWRAVDAEGYLFIHCIWVYSKNIRGGGAGTWLLEEVIARAKQLKMKGVAIAVSEKPWIATKELFLKHGFKVVDTSGGYELMALNFEKTTPPKFMPWEDTLQKVKGWQLFYTHQCPMFAKCLPEIIQVAEENGIALEITEYSSAEEARQGPSIYGVFSLVKDGKLLADHYISTTRFRNIVNKELKA